MTGEIKSFRDLIVWQKAMEITENVYTLTEKFPRHELYGLVSQMRRCSVSIASNIAEGKARGTRRDYRHFVVNAYASGAELQTQIELSKRLGYLETESAEMLIQKMDMTMKMLFKLIATLAVSE